MADMLIDGVKLDACNTAEADAIRAKTGGTDPIPYDYANSKGFADAIAAIPSGGGEDYAKYAKSISFYEKALPENVNIEFVNTVSMDSTFRQITGCKNLKISQPDATKYYLTFYKATLEKIDVTAAPFSGDSQGAFWDCGFLKTIIGLNLSLAANVLNIFTGTRNLESISLVPNSCAISISYVSCSKLTDASLVNIANSLVSGANTLTLHSTSKANCTLIVGTVSSITDITGTYDIFTEDASGTVTLLDFITNTKGWTVA